MLVVVVDSGSVIKQQSLHCQSWTHVFGAIRERSNELHAMSHSLCGPRWTLPVHLATILFWKKNAPCGKQFPDHKIEQSHFPDRNWQNLNIDLRRPERHYHCKILFLLLSRRIGMQRWWTSCLNSKKWKKNLLFSKLLRKIKMTEI